MATKYKKRSLAEIRNESNEMLIGNILKGIKADTGSTGLVPALEAHYEEHDIQITGSGIDVTCEFIRGLFETSRKHVELRRHELVRRLRNSPMAGSIGHILDEEEGVDEPQPLNFDQEEGVEPVVFEAGVQHDAA